MTLDKCKLDVICKTQTNPFNWRGQFTPDLVAYLLDTFAKEGCVVADPFAGSGTVLLECAKRGYSCIGLDINPSAYYMSKFYEYSNLSTDKREDLMQTIRTLIGSAVMSIADTVPIYVDDKDYRKAYSNLLDFSKWIANNTPMNLWPFLINVLFLCEKDKKLPLKNSLIANLNKIRNYLFELPFTTSTISAKNEDARRISSYCNSSVDLILTSPPYVNVFNYHQNFRGIVECFQYNICEIASSEIGSNRKHRSNRYKTVVQYAEDMGRVLCENTKALKTGGKMIYIVGKESNVRKTPFYNSQIISDLVDCIPGLNVVDIYHRYFMNRFGETIQEDLLEIEKETCSPDAEQLISCFETVGFKHLEKAIPYSPEENKADIYAILEKKDVVFESPILKTI